jgi:tRNA threonylcarbamoyl adenosine modification protein YeaZ
MKLLAVDTALGACSVALIDGDRTLAHRFILMERGHAEALAPMVDAVMRDAAIAFSEIDKLGVTTGPGTFTGQRVGLAFMRGLRVALKKPLAGVTTLSAMAHQAMAETGKASGVAIHDARREEVYIECIGALVIPPTLMRMDDALTFLRQYHRDFAVAGTAAEAVTEKMKFATLSTVRQPDALWVAKLSQEMDTGDAPPDPLYLREPDAKLPS